MDVCGKLTDWPGYVCGLAPGHPSRCYPAGLIEVGEDGEARTHEAE